MTENRLFEILEEAVAFRVTEELPQCVGRYQFTHALIRETLSSELSTTRKVRLHARFAQALEELYGDDAEAHAAELAHHYSEADAMIGLDRLVYYSLLAGEGALAPLVDAPQPEVTARYYATQSLIPKGDLKEAQRQATAALAPAERLRDRWLGLALAVNGLLSIMEGDFEAARDFSDHG